MATHTTLSSPKGEGFQPSPTETLSPTLAYKARGYSGVDCKSTIVGQGFTLLRLNILLDHLIGNIARTHGQVPPGPEVPPPKLLLQMRKLLQQDPGADAFEPLHDLADVLVRLVLDEHMHMVTGHFARDNLQFVFQRDLPQHISHSHGNLARQHAFAILRNPAQVNFQIRLRVCPKLVTSHGDTYYPLFA